MRNQDLHEPIELRRDPDDEDWDDEEEDEFDDEEDLDEDDEHE